MSKTNTGKYTFVFGAVLVMFIIINAAAGYFNYGQKEYFPYGDYIFSREMLIDAEREISSWKCSEYQTAYEELSEEYSELEKYCRAVKIFSGERPEREFRDEFTKEEARKYVSEQKITTVYAKERMKFIEYIKNKLGYSLNYPGYISAVKNSSENMNRTEMVSDSEKKRIIRSAMDYYGLENLQVSAVTDEGINLIFSDTISDILACLAAVICAYMYSVRCRLFISRDAVRKNRFWIFALVFAAAVSVLYSVNIYTADMFLPVGDMGRSLQSVRMFYCCPYMISTGTFLALRILIKTAASMTLFCIFTAFFLAEKKILPVCIFAAVSALETAAVLSGFKYHFISEFSPEKVLSDYIYVMIFGEPVNPVLVYAFMIVVILVVCVWAAAGKIKRTAVRASEISEQEYFEEINKRYNESRMIRHDIKNHITVISMLLDNGDTEGIRKYIGDLSEELDSVRPPVKTGSGVLDALLFRKMSYAAENKIVTETEFMTDFSGLRFSDYDLCGIFSNILDNAFEASLRLNDNRKVLLSVKEQMDMICIFCENHFKEIKYSSGSIITLKSDNLNHGLGLKRIKQIASKYDGTVDIKNDDNIFSISVMLLK